MRLLDEWNKQPFSIYTSEEKGILGLLKRLGVWVGKVIEQIDFLDKLSNENKNKKVSYDDMREMYNFYKDLESGKQDYRGSWFGIKRPEYAEPGIQGQVTLNRENLEEVKEKIKGSISISFFSKNESETDDTQRIKRAIDYCLANNLKLLFNSNEVYTISETIYIKASSIIDFNNCTIDLTTNVNGLVLSKECRIYNLRIYCKSDVYNKCLVSINQEEGGISRIIADNIRIYGHYDNGDFQNISDGIGLDISSTIEGCYALYNRFRNIDIIGFNIGINISILNDGSNSWINANTFDNIHIDKCRELIKIDGNKYRPGFIANETSGNRFTNLQLQFDKNTNIGLNIKGAYNYFSGVAWDTTIPEIKPTMKVIVCNEDSEYNIFNLDSIFILRYNKFDVDYSNNIVNNSRYQKSSFQNSIDRIIFPMSSKDSSFSGDQEDSLTHIDKLGGVISHTNTTPSSGDFEMFRVGNGSTNFPSSDKTKTVTSSITLSKPFKTLRRIIISFTGDSIVPLNMKIIINDSEEFEPIIYGNNVVFECSSTNVSKIAFRCVNNGFYGIKRFSAVAPSENPSSFLPFSGGKILGDLDITGNRLFISKRNGTGKYRLYIDEDGSVKADSF